MTSKDPLGSLWGRKFHLVAKLPDTTHTTRQIQRTAQRVLIWYGTAYRNDAGLAMNAELRASEPNICAQQLLHSVINCGIKRISSRGYAECCIWIFHGAGGQPHTAQQNSGYYR